MARHRRHYSNIFEEIIKMTRNSIDEEEDFDNRSQHEIAKRDEGYTSLLSHFVEITERRNNAKESYKWVFFKIVMGLLIVLAVLACATVVVILCKCNGNQLADALPAIITALIGFASAIIAVPLAITKYLFSTKEDKYITEIISHTQEHDQAGRRLIKALSEEQVAATEEQVAATEGK